MMMMMVMEEEEERTLRKITSNKDYEKVIYGDQEWDDEEKYELEENAKGRRRYHQIRRKKRWNPNEGGGKWGHKVRRRKENGTKEWQDDDWLTDWLPNWLTDWLTSWLSDILPILSAHCSPGRRLSLYCSFQEQDKHPKSIPLVHPARPTRNCPLRLPDRHQNVIVPLSSPARHFSTAFTPHSKDTHTAGHTQRREKHT